MNNFKRLTAIAALFIASSIALSAQAVIIDFEGVAPPGTFVEVGQNYVEDGFNLFNPAADSDAVVVSATAGFNATGSDFYGWNSIAQNNPVVLTSLTGNFDLLSLDVGAIVSGSAVSFDIIGSLFGGGTLTYNVINADPFQNVLLNWAGLSSVAFNFVGGINSDSFPAIDNIDVSAAAVPTPATLALLAIGFLGMGAAARRKSA